MVIVEVDLFVGEIFRIVLIVVVFYVLFVYCFGIFVLLMDVGDNFGLVFDVVWEMFVKLRCEFMVKEYFR